MTHPIDNSADETTAPAHPGADCVVARVVATGVPGSTPLREDSGDWVDRSEPFTDDPAFERSHYPRFSALIDRQGGNFAPLYQCEADLARLRGRVHNLVNLTATHVGVVDALANYVVGSGFACATHPLDDSAAQLAGDVQRTLDRFLDDNDFYGALDREAHNRSREEGEAFLALFPQPGGGARARFLECDQIVEPADPRPLEDWLGCGDEFPSCWKYGIHTPARETDRALGYHVIYDSSGADWDYVPVGRMEHFKRNVTANAKRGVSDFHPVLGDLEREARLRRNTTEGAALQAAIAWILELPPGSRPTAPPPTSTGEDFFSFKRYGSSGSQMQPNARRYPPGTILSYPSGMQYKPGPLGSERNADFVLVAQYVLRAIAVRWNIPEYLISADASNANYASALVAESPFVKAREADQQFYKRRFKSLLWKVVRLAWEAGRFARLGVSWETLASLVEIKIDLPAVATRDSLKLAQTQELQMQLGFLSPRTAAAQAGLDYDAEVAHGAGTAAGPEPAG